MINHIFLIGYRGAGKSTIGKLLATTLKCGFVDTDDLICRRCNMRVADIVAAEGWESFRRYEAEALLEAAGRPAGVIATGGGAVLHHDIWEQIRQRGLIVWLYADIATLAVRLTPSGRDDVGRPSLTGGDIRSEISEVLAERLPLYAALADMEVDTGKNTKAEAVEMIVQEYCRRYAGERD